MTQFSLKACNAFLDECGSTISAEQLFRAIIVTDENGCPAIKATIVPSANQPAAVVQTPSLIRATGAGSVAEGSKSVLVENVGGQPGSVLGIQILPGEKVPFKSSGEIAVLGAVSYDGTETTLLISIVV